MTIDEFLTQSNKCIQYADSIMERDPEKARQLLAAQLGECTKLISRIDNQKKTQVNYD